jgi:recombination protein RecA
MGLIQQGEHTIGQRVQAKILKSANIAPTHPVEFDIIYNQGINYQGEVFDLGLQLGLIHKQGEGYTFQSLSLGTERRQAIETLERRALIRPIERVIRQMLLGRSFLVET